jgi:hypothetical protein
VLAAVGAVFTGATDAIAQTATAAADDPRALLQRAMDDFRAGNFRPALQTFQRTYDLTGNPAVLFNIAVTLQRLGEPGEAARTLRRFLIAQPQAPNRAEVENQIRTLEAEDAHLHPASAGPASAAPTPIVTGVPSSPPPSAHTETPPARSIVGPIAVTAAGGAALVTGIVFFALREAALGDLRNACTVAADAWHCDDTPALMQRYGDAGTFTAVGVVTGIVGVLAVAGGVAWLILPTREPRRDSMRVGFDATPNGGAITLRGTF